MNLLHCICVFVTIHTVLVTIYACISCGKSLEQYFEMRDKLHQRQMILYCMCTAHSSDLHPSQSCPRFGWTRGSGRVGSGHDFAGFRRVGSGQHFGFFSFLLIISWYLNRYESSNTIFGSIDFLRSLIYNN